MYQSQKHFEVSATFKFVDESEAFWKKLENLEFDFVVNWQGAMLTGTAIIPAKTQAQAFAKFQLASNTLGLSIEKMDLSLVSISDIAEELAVSRETVRMWTEGKRRKNFPQPFAQIGGSNIWAWSEVYTWVRSNLKIATSEIEPLDVRFLQGINSRLSSNGQLDNLSQMLINSLAIPTNVDNKWAAVLAMNYLSAQDWNEIDKLSLSSKESSKGASNLSSPKFPEIADLFRAGI